MRLPSRTPGGTFTRQRFVCCVAPRPPHVRHGFSMIEPRPPQREHGSEMENLPCPATGWGLPPPPPGAPFTRGPSVGCPPRGPPPGRHASAMSNPPPPQREHGCEMETRPCPSVSTPRPPHCGHVRRLVPGSAPL